MVIGYQLGTSTLSDSGTDKSMIHFHSLQEKDTKTSGIVTFPQKRVWVAPRLHPYGKMSLKTHLIFVESDGRASFFDTKETNL